MSTADAYMAYPPTRAPEVGELTDKPVALLLRRTFDSYLRLRARCGGRTSIRAVVTDRSSVEKIVRALERLRDPPAAA